MAEKFDVLYDIRHSLTASDFKTVLDYYNIQVKNRSILCPFHHDKHYGSCSINKDGKGATCWVCAPNKPGGMGRSISAVDIVMLREGLEFRDALEYLWCTILGNPMPEYYSAKKSFPLNSKELKLIGMPNAHAGMVPVVVNCCYRNENLPDKLERKKVDDERYDVIRNIKAESLYSLYDSDKKATLEILRGKALEAERAYLDMIGDTFDRESENWSIYISDREGVLKLRESFHARVAEVRRILAKLEQAS